MTTGMTLITPSSVSAVGGSSSISITKTGLIEFTTCEDFYVDGVFSSTYENYLIVMSSAPNTQSQVVFRFRGSGATYSSTTYNFQKANFSSTSITAAKTNTDSYFDLDNQNNGVVNGSHIWIYRPNVAAQSSYRYYGYSGVNTVELNAYGGVETSSTQHDGWAIGLTGSNTITGYATVYGYNQ